MAFFAKKTIFVVLDAREMGESKNKEEGGGEGERISPPLPPPFFRSHPISRASKNKKIGFLVQKTSTETLATQAIQVVTEKPIKMFTFFEFSSLSRRPTTGHGLRSPGTRLPPRRLAMMQKREGRREKR